VSKEIDTSSAVLRKRLFWILCYDLRAVTAVPAVVQPLVAGALATLERFVRLWDLFQGMDPTPRRRVQSHVPVESNSWVHAFTLGTHTARTHHTHTHTTHTHDTHDTHTTHTPHTHRTHIAHDVRQRLR
jgi:hypothetical protein